MRKIRKKMYNNVLALGIIYIVVLTFFSMRWKNVEKIDMLYTFNGDQNLFLEDKGIFHRKYMREIRNLKTDLEKSEWTSERLKDLFQMFVAADVSLLPYQMAVSALSSCVVISHLNTKMTWVNLITCSFIFFVLMDLPRRFMAFHRNALIANKAINLHTYYYKYLKGRESVERKKVDSLVDVA
jgi:hypothetical protein